MKFVLVLYSCVGNLSKHARAHWQLQAVAIMIYLANNI